MTFDGSGHFRFNKFFHSQALARQLQELEGVILTQEEKDRLVAMEAQDKELARMLQERVSDSLSSQTVFRLYSRNPFSIDRKKQKRNEPKNVPDYVNYSSCNSNKTLNTMKMARAVCRPVIHVHNPIQPIWTVTPIRIPSI